MFNWPFDKYLSYFNHAVLCKLCWDIVWFTMFIESFLFVAIAVFLFTSVQHKRNTARATVPLHQMAGLRHSQVGGTSSQLSEDSSRILRL